MEKGIRGTLTVRERRGPLGGYYPRPDVPVPVTGEPVWAYIPDRIKALDHAIVQLNGRRLEDKELYTEIPKDGDLLVLTPIAGFVVAAVGFLISLAVTVALKIGEYHWTKRDQRRREHSQRRAGIGPSYAIHVMENRMEDGAPIPVVFGRHRCGGILIQQYTDSVEEGIDRLNTVLAISQGPVNKISSAWVNGNSISDMHGASLSQKLGNVDQGALADVPGEITTVAANDQLLENSAVTASGTTAATRFKLKVYFPSGIYKLDHEADMHTNEWTCRVRYRTHAGPGAWTNAKVIQDHRRISRVNQDSLSGTSRLYITPSPIEAGAPPTNHYPSGTVVVIGKGTIREETLTVNNVGVNYIDFTGAMAFDHYAVFEDTVHLLSEIFYIGRRRSSPFSVWIRGDFPTSDTYDIEVMRTCGNQQGRYYYDAYLKEYQQVSDQVRKYPCIALAAIKAVATEQLTGQVGRQTVECEGVLLNAISSATLVGAPHWTRKPEEIALASIYNREWGLGNRIDSRVELTLGGIAGVFTVGEEVQGPAVEPVFAGIVKSWSSPTLVVEVVRGFPNGLLTGQSSGATGTVSSVDECYAVNLPQLYAWGQFCAGDAPSGIEHVVNHDSPAAGNKVYVDEDDYDAADPAWATGDTFWVSYGVAKQEKCTVNGTGTDGTGFYILTLGALSNTHASADTPRLVRIEARALFDFVADGSERGWDFLQRLARTCFGRLIRTNMNYITIIPWKEETPAQLFTLGNIKTTGKGKDRRSSFQLVFHGTGTRPNRMTLHYLDEEQDFREMPAAIDSPEAYSAGEKIIPAVGECYGVIRRGHAHRLALRMLNEGRYSPYAMKFLTGIEGLDVNAGDVINVQHDLTGVGLAGGRVISSTNDTVRLDHPIDLPAGTYTIRVRHADDTQETQVITTAAGHHQTLSIAAATWTQNPAAGDLFAIYATTLVQARVTGWKQLPNLDHEIEAEADSTSIYTEDIGVAATYTPEYLPDPGLIPPDVTGVTLTQGTQEGVGQGVIHFIEAHWYRSTEHPAGTEYDVYVREMSDQRWVTGAPNFGPSSGTTGFDHPRGLAAYGDYLYVADERNNQVVKMNRYTGVISARSSVSMSSPYDVDTDGTYVYVADMGNHQVQVLLCSDLSFHVQVGSMGSGNGEFIFPCALATDGGSSLWVCDLMNHRVQRFTIVAGVPAYAAQVGSYGTGNANFSKPCGIDVEGNYIYIADSNNNRVKKHDKGGAMGYVGEFGSAGISDGEFDTPMDVALDSSGNIFVADYGSHRIQKFDSSFTFLMNFGVAGVPSPGPDHFMLPRGIAHYDGKIFVAEAGFHRVQMRWDGVATAESFDLVGSTSGQELRITRGISPGYRYRVAVVSRSRFGARKLPNEAPYADITTTATAETPADVTGLSASRVGHQVRLWWDQIQMVGFLGYEVRAGVDWDTGRTVLQRYTATEATVNAAPHSGTTSRYWIKGISTSLVKSENAAYVDIDTPWVGAIANLGLVAAAGSNLRTS